MLRYEQDQDRIRIRAVSLLSEMNLDRHKVTFFIIKGYPAASKSCWTLFCRLSSGILALTRQKDCAFQFLQTPDWYMVLCR